MKVSAFVAASIDGFIARRNGSLDWLPKHDPSEDYGFKDYINSVDLMVMGRNTFAKVITLDTWPYGKLPIIVLSSKKPSIPKHLAQTVRTANSSPKDLVTKMTNHGVKHLYIDGGITIQRFIAAGLIDEITISRVPILLGRGVSLFTKMPKDVQLEHLTTQSYDNGIVKSSYQFTH